MQKAADRSRRAFFDKGLPVSRRRLSPDRRYIRQPPQESLAHDEDDLKSVNLLKTGRHFRLASGTKAIVGRDEKENERLLAMAGDNDRVAMMEDHPGPVVLLRIIKAQYRKKM